MSTVVTRYKRNASGQVEAWQFQSAEQVPAGYAVNPRDAVYVPPVFPAKIASEPRIEPVAHEIPAPAQSPPQTEMPSGEAPKRPGRKPKSQA